MTSKVIEQAVSGVVLGEGDRFVRRVEKLSPVLDEAISYAVFPRHAFGERYTSLPAGRVTSDM